MAEEPARPSPCLIAIFGASGDLTKRKLIPALYDCYVAGSLPERFGVVGLSRTAYDDASFREHLEPFVRRFADAFDAASWSAFAEHVHYRPADTASGDDYPRIKKELRALADHHGTGENVLYYLSVAPHLYEPIVELLGEHDMVTEGKRWCSLDRENPPWQRVVVEKPFGSDAATAHRLNQVLGRVFEEESIYRIDHYLGKNSVQNLLVFRFANAIFEPIWSRHHIDHVQITAAETVGVEGRGKYYDSESGGALKDMIQSHLLQLVALTAMEPPVRMEADDIRMEKAKVLSATRVPAPEDAVRGQYAGGTLEGEAVPGYREEGGVDPATGRETYAAMRLWIDTWRWHGVPFYVRSGKRMPRKTTRIVVHFKPTPHCLFRDHGPAGTEALQPNQIVIDVQPDEGIRLRFGGKVPGSRMRIAPVAMDFDYVEQFRSEPPEAYATLLLDAMRGDQTLFKHREEIEGAWRIVDPVAAAWARAGGEAVPRYPAGTWGPREAADLLAADGRAWHDP